MKYTKEERENSIKELKELLKDNPTIYLILRSVSRSGMSRVITPLIFKNGEPYYLTYKVARALNYSEKIGYSDGVKVEGTGMDMGFHLVYSLSRTLFDDGYKLKMRWL